MYSEKTKLLPQKNTQVYYTDNDDEIITIAQDVNDVTKLFTDLHDLINDQGIVIDDIQSNIESAKKDVEDGNKTLVAANENQYGNLCSLYDPKLYFIILLVLGLIGFVIYITTRPKTT